jgi:hypothetical protein
LGAVAICGVGHFFSSPPTPQRGANIKLFYKFTLKAIIEFMFKNYKTPFYVIELARKFRKNLTDTEKIIWSKLKKRKINGYKF